MGKPECNTRLTRVWIWLSLVKYRVKELPPLFRAASKSWTTLFSRGREVRTPISSLPFIVSKCVLRERSHLLFIRIYTILLRCDEIEQGFGPAV